MPDLYSANKSDNNPKPDVSPLEATISAPKKETERDFIPSRRGWAASSLMLRPNKNVHFDTQEPEEEILMIIRAHWITNFHWVIISLILFFSPIVLTFFPLLSSFPPNFRFMFVVVWYLVLLMYVFEQFLSWFFNLTIITDERIIDVDFINLTTKKVSDADIEKIQDVTYNNSGAFGAIFNYGDVLVQTAAELTEFIFEKVPNPALIVSILQRLRTEEKVEAIEGRVR